MQAYQETAKTDADLLVMAMLGTADVQPAGDLPLVSEHSLLSAGHQADTWAACEQHPLCRTPPAADPDVLAPAADSDPLDNETTRSWDVSQPGWRERGHQAAPRRRPSILRSAASRAPAVHVPPERSSSRASA